uniref:Uncharacterized protein n=1 Tax=Anguilla anguilla TaxID=7936 RepID=A0A0E9UJ00_ANGAN
MFFLFSVYRHKYPQAVTDLRPRADVGAPESL